MIENFYINLIINKIYPNSFTIIKELNRSIKNRKDVISITLL